MTIDTYSSVDSLAPAFNAIETNDIPTQLANLNYRLDLVITILLFSVGLISAGVVIYLLYRFILRFI